MIVIRSSSTTKWVQFPKEVFYPNESLMDNPYGKYAKIFDFVRKRYLASRK